MKDKNVLQAKTYNNEKVQKEYRFILTDVEWDGSLLSDQVRLAYQPIHVGSVASANILCRYDKVHLQ